MENLTTVDNGDPIAVSGESSSELSTTPPNNLNMLDVVSADYKEDPTTSSQESGEEFEYFEIKFNPQGALTYNTNMGVYKALGAIDVVKTQMVKDITSAGDSRSILDAALENYYMSRK